MKRSTFIATIAGLFTFLGFKKKPEKGVHIFYDDDLRKPHMSIEITKGTNELFVQEGSLGYTNEATIIQLPSSDKVECSYIQDDKFMVVEIDTQTGEKKILRWYNTKDMRAQS